MARSLIPATFEMSDVRVTADRRDEQPLKLSPLRVSSGDLHAGHYVLTDWPEVVCVRRLSLTDLSMAVGTDRATFQEELDQMRICQLPLLVIEGSLGDIVNGEWPGRVGSQQIISSLLAWQRDGVPFHLWGDAMGASALTRQFLFITARKLYRQSRAMCLETMKNRKA